MHELSLLIWKDPFLMDCLYGVNMCLWVDMVTNMDVCNVNILLDHNLCKLGLRVLGYSYLGIGVETALSELWRQVLIRLASLASENLSLKWRFCSFNLSTPKFMFEYTSPLKLWLV